MSKKIKPKKLKNGDIFFSDHPEFNPNKTPKEMFQSGVFGGTYFRPIHSSITGKDYKDQHLEFPKSWWTGLNIKKYVTSSSCDISINKYGAKSGMSLDYWEKKKWIVAQDPYGWVQWYCRFYQGRRSSDDDRQIKRWIGVAGKNGRFMRWLVTDILKKGGKTHINDISISPAKRQGLLQWAYEITEDDYNHEALRRQKKKK